MPIVLANYALRPASFNSIKEKPLPNFCTPLYLIVYPLTTGLNNSTGRGEDSYDNN